MNHYDPEKMRKRDVYQLMTSLVVPRPIALVSSLGPNAVINVAPFSYFNAVSAEPPRLSIALGHRLQSLKDTAKNILDHGAFVVNVVDETMMEDMNRTAAPLKRHESELTQTAFTLVDSDTIRVPGIKESKARFECVLERTVAFDDTTMIIGRIQRIYVDQSIMVDGRVDVMKLNPVGRLSGNDYALLGKRITLKRPE